MLSLPLFHVFTRVDEKAVIRQPLQGSGNEGMQQEEGGADIERLKQDGGAAGEVRRAVRRSGGSASRGQAGRSQPA